MIIWANFRRNNLTWEKLCDIRQNVLVDSDICSKWWHLIKHRKLNVDIAHFVVVTTMEVRISRDQLCYSC